MDIDHERFKYDPTFLGSDRELVLIHLLDNFNALGHSWRRHVISLNDLLPTTLAYAALRTWANPSVRQYLSQIQIWDENRYWPGLGFRYFEDLAIEIRFLCHRQPRVKRADDPALSTHFRRPVALAVLLRFPRLCRIWRICQSTLSRSDATAGIDPEGREPAPDNAEAADREPV